MKTKHSQLCSVVEVVTPKKVRLDGLWFGSQSPKRVFIWVHGLGSSLFSKVTIAEKLVGDGVSVLAFNNRGHDVVSRISHASRLPSKLQQGGAAHEVFTDCVDDIQGAINFARKLGAQEIYLVGHSTGCQKSVYWAATRGRGIKGIVLLAPISDYSAEVHLKGKKKVLHALKVARALIGRGQKHTILSPSVWPQAFDAQRFVSLCSADSKEEMFTYWDPKKTPRTLKSVRVPILTLLAENDEYADRPATEMAAWFGQHAKKGDRVEIVPRVQHSFRGGEDQVAVSILMYCRPR